MEWIKTILCQFTLNPVVNGNNNTHLLPQALSFLFTRPPSLPPFHASSSFSSSLHFPPFTNNFNKALHNITNKQQSYLLYRPSCWLISLNLRKSMYKFFARQYLKWAEHFNSESPWVLTNQNRTFKYGTECTRATCSHRKQVLKVRCSLHKS